MDVFFEHAVAVTVSNSTYNYFVFNFINIKKGGFSTILWKIKVVHDGPNLSIFYSFSEGPLGSIFAQMQAL